MTAVSRPLSVMHVISTPDTLGGAERVVEALVVAGRPAGIEQLVLNPFQRCPRSPFADVLPEGTYQGRRIASWHDVVSARAWIEGWIRNWSPQLLHVHLFHALVTVATLPRRRRPPKLLTHHHASFYAWEGRRLPAAVDRWSGERYERVVAVSDWTRRMLVETYRYPPERVVRIYNGWAGRPREHLGGGLRPTVVCIANFRPQKGHHVLLRAFSIVCRQIPESRLVLVGEGELERELRRRSEEPDLADHVEFTGRVEDVWPLLAAADVFALASWFEPLGICVLEAMAAGLPVVASRVGGITEIVRPGETGELFEPGDVDALASQLVRLLRSPAARSRLRVAARERACSFTNERMAHAYFDLYQELVGSPSSE